MTARTGASLRRHARRLLATGLATVTVATLMGTALTAVSAGSFTSSPSVVAAATVSSSKTATPRRWLSGASGDGVANGRFGTWRGAPVAIAGTWNDSKRAQANMWSLARGAEYGAWTKPIDIAVGGIFEGDSWSAAARGAYDARWRASLTKLKSHWGSRPKRNLYLRFAHEFNGDWYAWKVSGNNVTAYKQAYRRWSAMADKILPGHRNVWSPTNDTSGSLRLDPRKAFPGSNVVDVIGLDAYNQFSPCNTATACRRNASRTGAAGAPIGVESWRMYAAKVGEPLALSEWGTPGVPDRFDPGRRDAPGYIAWMHSWIRSHAGTGKGRVLYDIYFNVGSYSADKRFSIYPTPRHNTRAAAKYRTLF